MACRRASNSDATVIGVTVPLKPAGSRVDEEGMRWLWLVALLAVVGVATVWSAGGEIETGRGASATTSSVVAETSPTPSTFPVPPPPPPRDPPPPVPPGGGGGEILNVHSQVLPFRPGQTSWTSTSTAIAVTVRSDRAAPKAGEAVAFEVVVTTATEACCRVVLRPGGDASYDSGGGLGCLPPEAVATRTATFRWVHVYESSGHFTLSVTARAGTCSEPPATGGLTGVIEVV